MYGEKSVWPEVCLLYQLQILIAMCTKLLSLYTLNYKHLHSETGTAGCCNFSEPYYTIREVAILVVCPCTVHARLDTVLVVVVAAVVGGAEFPQLLNFLCTL